MRSLPSIKAWSTGRTLPRLTLDLVIVAVPDNNIKYFKPIFGELRKAVEAV
jgi:hypothetical protein